MKPRLVLMLLLTSLPAIAQHPENLVVSDVVAGSKKIPTRYAYATGKWSDARNDIGVHSTEVHCYQRFGFCELANAYSMQGQAWVDFNTYDILRWDNRELIAVDSSPICIVNTLRFDLAAKKVTHSATSKGETKNKVCNAIQTPPTAFLIGVEDELKRIESEKNTKR